MSKEKQFDVAAVEISTGNVLWVDGPYDAQSADAVIKMAVMRQGVEDRFFAPCSTGSCKQGDRWDAGVAMPTQPEDLEYQDIEGTRYPLRKRGL